MEAGAGVAVIILIILAVAVIFLWPSIQQLFVNAGNNGGNPPPKITYKNDGITLERTYINPLNPYAGSVVSIGFTLQNNVEYPIPYTEVNFFDLKGLNVLNLNCDDGTSITDATNGIYKCIFNNQNNDLDMLDFKPIEITLQTPASDVITSDTPIIISYSIKYDYFGYRIANIPVIDGTTRTEPMSKFSQSDPTYGPILMDFELPVVSEKKEGDTVIKEYWVVGSTPFELKMNFKHVGSSSMGIINPINISAGKAILRTTSLDRAQTPDGSTLPCDFPVKVGEYFKTDKLFVVPRELICNFKANIGTQPEITANAYAEYNYTYSFIKTETFTVRPLPKE